MQWSEILADPSLQDLPFKIESNRFGQVVMSPGSNEHARIQGHLAGYLLEWKKEGAVLTECSVETAEGVKVPDVAWASRSFMEEQAGRTPFTRAPEICAEVVSPSSTDEEIREKVALYLASGAHEVWAVGLDGERQVFSGGEVFSESKIAPSVIDRAFAE